jgi:hypothetical protein
MVFAAALIHPFSLRLIASHFRYEDKILPCDALFVPRFPEDRDGEVYDEAFREYWAGNGRSIWIEDDHLFSFTLKDIVSKMAKERGIKDNIVNALRLEGDDVRKAATVTQTLYKQGFKKVVLVVPEYASRRFHTLYTSVAGQSGDFVLFLVKPVDVTYFEAKRWWRNDVSRGVMLRELVRFGIFQLSRFKHGDSGNRGKNNQEPQTPISQSVGQRPSP